MKIDSATLLTISKRGLTGSRARGDVQENQLVGSIGIIAPCLLDRVAGVTQRLEVHPFDHPSAGHVQAGNDSPG